MSGPPSRLRSILGHILPSTLPPSRPSTQPSSSSSSPSIGTGETHQHTHNTHTLSPTIFLPRAASIEPHAEAIVHITVNGTTLRRTYQEFADRARGLAYYIKTHGFKRVGVLMPNTPAFLESVYGIVAGGAAIVPVNYRLKEDDVRYIFEFSDVEIVLVDWELEELLTTFRKSRPDVKVIVDTDTDATEGELCGPFDEIVLEGLTYDRQNGSKGWEGLHVQAENEDDMLAIPFTSGTTSKPKGVVYTHRGSYLATLGNVIETGLNVQDGRCKYLWTLPMQVFYLLCV